jgi:hypothetical protein
LRGFPDNLTQCVPPAGVYEISDATELPKILEQARFLTAPIAIVKTPANVQLFGVQKSISPSPLETGTTDNFDVRFKSRIADLSPVALQQIKLSNRNHELFDVGLWPWAEKITSARLVELLEAVVLEGLNDLPERYRDSEAAKQAVIKLIFHLFACRVLQDKQLIGLTDDPEDALKTAHETFSDNIDPRVARSQYISRAMLKNIAEKLRTRFAFSSLSSEMLGTAYEKSLVTPKLRRERGIYYTPPSITNYVLSQLPIESIPEDDRILCDPCCGSGSFLLAGFERLAALLPSELSPAKRHQYLRARLLGFDIDDFAREIATLSLVLADVYNKNGWKIDTADATALGVSHTRKRPSIIVTNPPFRHIKKHGRRHEMAADILVNLIELMADNGLMGVVLPQSILDSGAGEAARSAMLNKCDILEIDLLSSGLFFSAAEVAIVLLRKRRRGESRMSGITTIREVRPTGISEFKTNRIFTRTYSADPRRWVVSSGQKFIVSPLSELWGRLKISCQPLRKGVKLMAGLQLELSDTNSVHRNKMANDNQYIDRLDVLRPYAMLPDDGSGEKYKWITYGTHLRRAAEQTVFQSEKVLFNSNRNPGSVWRIVAAVAPRDLYFSDNFHAAIPIDSEMSLEEIAAVLNSPVANAWFDAHCRKRKIVLQTLGDLPIPSFSPDQRKEIKKLVREIKPLVISNWTDNKNGLYDDKLTGSNKYSELRSRLDAIVADAYKLSSEDVRQLSKLVGTDRRPG